MDQNQADCRCSPRLTILMNKHDAIRIAAVAAVWIVVQIIWGKLIWGNTWKQAVYFTLFGAIVGIIATFVICLFL